MYNAGGLSTGQQRGTGAGGGLNRTPPAPATPHGEVQSMTNEPLMRPGICQRCHRPLDDHTLRGVPVAQCLPGVGLPPPSGPKGSVTA